METNKKIIENSSEKMPLLSSNSFDFNKCSTSGLEKNLDHSTAINITNSKNKSGSFENVFLYDKSLYYNRLHNYEDSNQPIPDHMVSLAFHSASIPKSVSLCEDNKPKQSSFVTIFSLWNTMMGSSLLSMPWGIEQAGFATGIIIMAVMMAICLYTAYRIIRLQKDAGLCGRALEFQDMCRIVLGRWAEAGSVVFSMSALLGAIIVYWVLISNFLYSTVTYAHDVIVYNNGPIGPNRTEVLCPKNTPLNHTLLETSALLRPDNNTGTWSFQEYWNPTTTVPLYIIAVLGPIVCIKSPTFFTKFNAFGTICVMYIIAFVAFKASVWGIHIDFNDVTSKFFAVEFKPSFASLPGILSLAYFIHNCIIPVMRHQEHPENNGRDLTIVYFLVMGCYMFVGVVAYISFPLAKSCIEDNLFNNFPDNDIPAFIGRLCLLLQLVTVLPLLMYLLRTEILYVVFGSAYPSFKHVLGVNTILITICVLFAVFMPSIGVIIRFTGSFSGLAFIFTLPCLTYIAVLRKNGRLTFFKLIFNVTIILIGVINFTGQFV